MWIYSGVSEAAYWKRVHWSKYGYKYKISKTTKNLTWESVCAKLSRNIRNIDFHKYYRPCYEYINDVGRNKGQQRIFKVNCYDIHIV